MKRDNRPQTPQQALETAYWLNWCGDHKYARDMLVRITEFVINRKVPNEQQKKYPQQATPQKGTEEGYDEHLVR